MNSLNVFLKWVIVFVCVTYFTASFATAESPKAKVQTTIEAIRTTVINEKSKLSTEDLNKKLEELVFPVFDFKETSKRCLGPNWKNATPEEQEEFVDLFSNLLSRTYVNKIREGVETSEVTYTDEKFQGRKALVKSKIKTDKEEAQVDYRFYQTKDGRWLVYDVIIENVGLISNYRSEFAGIIRKEKFPGLLKKLREKEIAPKSS